MRSFKRMFERKYYPLAMSCLLTMSAYGQDVRNDTITDRTHQLREVTITESRRQHVTTSTAPLHILDHEQMLSLGVTDVFSASFICLVATPITAL